MRIGKNQGLHTKKEGKLAKVWKTFLHQHGEMTASCKIIHLLGRMSG